MNTKTELFCDEQSGRIACFDHVGMYAQSDINARPKARKWATPLGAWSRWTAADEAEWIEFAGSPARCESCR